MSHQPSMELRRAQSSASASETDEARVIAVMKCVNVENPFH